MRVRVSGNPFVFVVGCPRSGTTLLQRMLDNHPQLAVANDTHFIPRALQKAAPHRIADAVNGASIPLDSALVEALVSYRRFGRTGLTATQARQLAARSHDYADCIRRIYTSYAKQSGKPYGGEKTPDYVRHLPLLHGLFPGARSVHIVRDGRDVALSTLQWAGPTKGPGRWPLWQRDAVGACALWWRFQVETGRGDRSSIPAGHHTEVRYESLVADPETHLRRIAGFLNLPYAESMAQFHRGKTTADASKSAKANWMPATKGLRNWRTEMAAEDVALFERVAGDTLDSTGYERGASRSFSPSTERRAAACLDWWDAFVARRQRKAFRRLEAIR